MIAEWLKDLKYMMHIKVMLYCFRNAVPLWLSHLVYIIVFDKCIFIAEPNAVDVVGHDETNSLLIHVKECHLFY